jgi:hypothetical protein
MNVLRKSRAFATTALLLALGAVAATAQSKDPFRAAPPELEEALMARVSQFYDYFKMAKFRQAEDLVVEEAKEHFYGAKKSRIFGYEIRNVKFSEDLKEAHVLVMCLTPVPGLGSKPLSVPLPSTWKSIDGEWFLYFETRQPGVEHDSPAGKMHFSQELGTHGSLTATQPATLESLKEMYAVAPSNLSFSSQTPDPVTKTFRVENRSKGELTLQTESKGMPGVTIDPGAGKIAVGESLTVSVTYVPDAHVGPGEYPLQFAVQPLAQHFEIKLLVE